MQEGSTQEHLFLQYQFQQHPQTTLLMKSGFFFFSRVMKTPRNNRWGIRSHSQTSPQPPKPVAWLLPTQAPISEQCGGKQAGSRLFAQGYEFFTCPPDPFPRVLSAKYFGGLSKETLSSSQCGKGCLDLRAFKLFLCFYPAVTPQSQC